MTSLLNRFILRGTLSEIHISMFPTHTRCKLTLQCYNDIYTVYYNYNIKWHRDKHIELMKLIPYLHGEIDGNVVANGEVYYKCSATDKPIGLFISGNMSSKGDRIYLNAMYIKPYDYANYGMDIKIKAMPLGGNKWMSIVNDSPRVFTISGNDVPKSNQIYELDIVYNVPYTTTKSLKKYDEMVINSLEKCDKLTIKSWKKCDIWLEDKDIANWLLEWEIINKDNV